MEDKGLMFGHLSASEPPPTMPPADPHSDQTNPSAPTMPSRKKKKVTRHWRDFIRPLMWRCKWAELKMIQLKSLALSSNESVDQTNDLADDQSLSVTSESPPLNEMDPELYMSNHPLFSYHENDVSAMGDFDNLVVKDSQEEDGFDMHNKQLFVEDKDSDMLRKIDAAQTRIQKLKAQLGVVISKNVDPFEAQISTQYGFHIPESTEGGIPSQVAVSSLLMQVLPGQLED